MSPSSKAPHRRQSTLEDELRLMDAWWRAANYLRRQIYLLDNPLAEAALDRRPVSSRACLAIGARPRA